MYPTAELLTILMPVFGIIFVMVITVTILTIRSKEKRAKISSDGQGSFERLVKELQQENAAIKSELTNILQKVESIENMMKDVQ